MNITDIKNNDNIWVKSAILGSLWASFEIIVGNFLHSIKIPFAGQFLASASVVLLISVFQIWNIKGIIIRAGFICAVMKLLSPGVNIFGPIIAILAEASLIEFAILIFGRNLIAYMMGGGFAIIWVLLQRVFNYLILYGTDLILLYNNIYEYALKSIPFASGSPIMPLIFLVIIYMLFGSVAGFIGYIVGQKALKVTDTIETFESINTGNIFKPGINFNYSKIKLFIVFIITVAFLSLNTFLNIYTKILFVIANCLLIIFWYKPFVKKIVKPKFWIQLIVITVLASYFISGVKDNNWGLNSNGLTAGIEMSMRALFLVFNFTAISIELKKPLTDLVLKSDKYKNFSNALNIAFAAVPVYISYISSDSTFFRHPFKSLLKLISTLK